MPKDGVIPTVNEKITPEQLTVFDPCMGSAHFGIYAFDVLMKIYTEYGYTEREAAAFIVQNNLYGLDIDDRAAQLASFAIMMKAMQYDKRFLKRDIQPHFYEIKESNHIGSFTVDYFANGNAKLKKDIQSIIEDTRDAKEYGSIIQIAPVDFDTLFARFEEIEADVNLYRDTALNDLLPLVHEAKILSDKYAVVATNPPYLNKFDAKLKKYIVDNYADYKGDLFSVFIYRNFGFCEKNGYSGFMTPMVWMFIKTYEPLRKYVLNNKAITTLIQFEYSAFEEATVPICSFVLKNGKSESKGEYFRLSDFTGGMEVQCKKVKEALANPDCGFFYESTQSNFSKIPGTPVAYWASRAIFKSFENKRLSEIATAKKGLTTSKDEMFLRVWSEVNNNDIKFVLDEQKGVLDKRWVPLNKGGDYRKWYGNNVWIIDWDDNGKRVKDFKGAVIRNEECYFLESISWNDITSGKVSFRYKRPGQIFNDAGPSIFGDHEILLFLLALCNSVVMDALSKLLAPTIHFTVGQLSGFPVANVDAEVVSRINLISNDNIFLSVADWDAFETSWDFRRHPLLPSAIEERWYDVPPDLTAIQTNGTSLDPKKVVLFGVSRGRLIEESYKAWRQECVDRFNQLKANEEELNRIFIDIYGLQDELTPEEEDKDVTVRKADLGRDIRSFVSYAVGCMFGRYSLDVDGLAYAGGDWDSSKYKTFIPDKDAIIPITDDEYFKDDIVGRFVEFVKVVYGADTLEENLKFIADALDEKGSTSREVIQNYFLNTFYKDHLKTYQKRPIYWLFDSGKKNGFKCLVYMHRYQPDTIARIRTDYIHEQQARYRTAISGLERQINGAPTSERVRLNKQLTKLKDQAEEVRVYEEKIHHLADQMISIDLDDGVKHNYAIFQDVLAKIK